MMHDADVGGEGCGGDGFATASVAQHIPALALVHVALEVNTYHVAALCQRQGRVVHLDAENLATRHSAFVCRRLHEHNGFSV